MALTDNSNSGFYMPVAPAYGGGYGNGGGFFGGDWAWILLLLLIGGNGWGFGGGFGMGGMMPWMMGMGAGLGGFGLDYLYPWLNNSQHISDGFRDQQLNTQIGDLRSDVNRGFGDVQLGQAQINQNICQTGNGIVNALNSGFNSAEVAANNRQMANMQQAFAAQTATMQGFNGVQSQLAQCCCDNRLATVQTQGVVQTEAAATRAAGSADTQKILDKLCQLEIDGVRRELAAEQRENANLRSDLMYARGQASQVEQTARILAGQAAEIDGVYNRLKNCPVGTVPVAGNTPLFNCNPSFNNGGCGCGGNGFGFAA